ncbi:hypothetical protein AB833_18615 [Chromatiales bacterium (ex Bugula neritina AB1)]|nr:hypothetical protein AB833_18615 [Chromatiales bacterium (ex Bugula neritina AB1)]
MPISSRLTTSRILLTLILLVAMPPAIGDELSAPTGPVLLKITGKISNTNSNGIAAFDLAMLESLNRTEFTTSSPWTKKPTLFTGVNLHMLLDLVGAQSTQIRASALDKYWFEADTDNFADVPAIVAYKKDNNYMRVRDQGPLWIMMPFDDYPDSLTESNKNTCVWQLLEIEVL